MKRIYLNNYWALFLDFITTFQELTYNNIPVPLLANFYQYLDDNLKEEMMKSDFKEYLVNKNLKEDQIQPHFERLLLPIKKPLKNKPIYGKVLLNFRYLRFEPNIYSEYFDPKQTIILAPWKIVNLFGIPVNNIEDYKLNVTELTQNFLEKANAIFSLNNKHPAFNNQYFQNKFINNIPPMLQNLVAVQRYLEEVPISCVIVGTTEDLICRILTIIAASKGIPSICMQHGFLGGEEAYLPVFSTKMAVYGQYEKDWYLNKGGTDEQIEIIGHPRFDNIFTQQYISKVTFQKEYELNERKKWVLIATQPYHDSLWIQLIEHLAQDPFIQILIKPHPVELRGDKYVPYEKLSLKYNSVKLILSKEVDIYDVLPNVDAVIVAMSTVGLEAMLFEKPVVILKKEFKDRDYNNYDKMGDFIQSDPLKLAKLVSQLVREKNLQSYAEVKRKEFLSYAYSEEFSSKRLLKLINNLTRGEM